MKKAWLCIGFFPLLAGCSGNVTSMIKVQMWADDDGVMLLTPEYTVQHIQGQQQTKVFAAFTRSSDGKNVKLHEPDGITVNGLPLSAKQHSNGWYYEGVVPFNGMLLIFDVRRPSGHDLVHRLELPALMGLVLPLVFENNQSVRVPVRYDVPPAHVVSDTYNMSILSPTFRFDFLSKKRTAENPYEFDRLPHIVENAIVFTALSLGRPPVGRHAAELYRQQRIALDALASRPEQTGWATLSHTVNFSIEVR